MNLRTDDILGKILTTPRDSFPGVYQKVLEMGSISLYYRSRDCSQHQRPKSVWVSSLEVYKPTRFSPINTQSHLRINHYLHTMTRTARASHPRALNRDRSESRTGLDNSIRKGGAGGHNWGSLADESLLEARALDDEDMEPIADSTESDRVAGSEGGGPFPVSF